MAAKKKDQPYNSLMQDVGQLFEKGRTESRRLGNHAQTLACWEIGRRISESELNEKGRATYGEALIAKLSEDLTKKYGRGFSQRNLNYMVMLGRTYTRTKLNNGLSWSQYCQLFTIPDEELRTKLEQKAIKEKLTLIQLQRLIRIERGRNREIPRPTGQLHTYRITRRKMLNGKAERYLDLGYGVYADLPDNAPPATTIHAVFNVQPTKPGKDPLLTPAPRENLWLYKARVERIVDADTLIVLVELLNNQHQRVRIRLAGVEIPERGTKVEAVTRRYVTDRLKNAKTILIKTRGMDRYGRYVADVLYSQKSSATERILTSGQHLNAQLIQRQRKTA